ncbi:galactokinase [Candidatus Epulonipiscium fishelsonii]|uniref:Galactokinase n=1 Tax=Candidatus Epulonipiscium fishelsonii TaxID=77094 RepID=A0ACC8XGR2_9FIRM|nr:galactokinase [Epulopiscium sp. SCG-B05WGA-EpuloA1]ONI42694.1 galactokinase [Epulopiscium sp. SCG-B11WGA-EpuloA1]
MEKIINCFKTVFKKECEMEYFSPGRINLIGEHIDYNGGLVLPSPITLGTYAGLSLREDKIVRAYSLNFDDLGIIEFSLDNLEFKEEDNWVNYVKAILKYLKEQFTSINFGFDVVVYGNLPNGAGLSSSASLEVLFATICRDLYNLPITNVDMALLGQKVENEYFGLHSGIMDQFSIALGKKDMAILLNCDSLEYEYFPLDLPNHKIIIMNTNKRRELTESKYNERRSECESALEKLQVVLDAKNLCEVTIEDLEKYKNLLTDIEFKRAKHVISENIRVKDATKAFKDNDIEQFGKLLNASHVSLKDDYAVTGPELDTLAESAWEYGAVGARMTGAGFSGCAIAIVENDKVDEFIKNVGDKYKDKIGYNASFYIASIGNGPGKL